MGQIIQMPALSKKHQSINNKIGKKSNQQKLKQNNVAKKSADILFFTGVRYERLEQCLSIPVNQN